MLSAQHPQERKRERERTVKASVLTDLRDRDARSSSNQLARDLEFPSDSSWVVKLKSINLSSFGGDFYEKSLGGRCSPMGS